MFRLILMLMLIAIIAMAVLAIVRVVSNVTNSKPGPSREDTMPETFQKIAYVALIVLMFGVVSGWLGAV